MGLITWHLQHDHPCSCLDGTYSETSAGLILKSREARLLYEADHCVIGSIVMITITVS